MTSREGGPEKFRNRVERDVPGNDGRRLGVQLDQLDGLGHRK